MNRSTNRLAHFGDRILWLAICELVDEAWPTNDKAYFNLQARLPSNRNYATVSGYHPTGGSIRKAGTKEEARIGKIYFEEGFEEALREARFFIKQTKAWRESLRFSEAATENCRADALAERL